MAFETPIFSLPGTLVAENDLSTSQYKFVEISNEGQVDVCDAATDMPVGVLQNDPSSGEQAQVMAIGVTKIQMDSSMAAGTCIRTSTDGQAASIDQTSTTANYYVAGYMLKDGSTVGAGTYGTAFVNCAPPIYNNV